MKILALTTSCLAAVLLLAPRAVLAPEPIQDVQPSAAEREHSVLEDHMHAIEDEVKALRRLLRDPSKAPESLAALAKLQTAVVAAKSASPRMLQRVPQADRAKFLTDYRREMVVLLERSLAIERALLDGKSEQALAAFEELRALEEPAHARFIDEEK